MTDRVLLSVVAMIAGVCMFVVAMSLPGTQPVLALGSGLLFGLGLAGWVRRWRGEG